MSALVTYLDRQNVRHVIVEGHQSSLLGFVHARTSMGLDLHVHRSHLEVAGELMSPECFIAFFGTFQPGRSGFKSPSPGADYKPAGATGKGTPAIPPMLAGQVESDVRGGS